MLGEGQDESAICFGARTRRAFKCELEEELNRMRAFRTSNPERLF
jgi:hypothetical protein